eukprot:gene4314-4567_t
MADSTSSTSAVDAVIDKWGGQLDAEDRDAIADEVAYQYYSALREQVGDKADAATLADINALARIPQQEKDAAFQQSNRVMRKILRPLGYKLLQLHGLDPATASPEAAQAALDAPLTPQQQQEIGRKLEELYQSVYEPEMKAVMAETGLDAQDPEATWREFEQEELQGSGKHFAVLLAHAWTFMQKSAVPTQARGGCLFGQTKGFGTHWCRQPPQYLDSDTKSRCAFQDSKEAVHLA